MARPPGISAKTWTAALTAFRDAVGADWVFTSEEDIALYRDAYSPLWGEPGERVASAAVAPATTEQVQKVVRAANMHRIPIYPVSTGKNLGYGGSAPNLSGSVVLDLKRMNKVVQVDDKRHFAIVEPGVAYFDLYRHIRERKLKVWIDCPDPGWGSLIGNSLDHGVGYTWGNFRDHFNSHCGMEVVLPNGEIMRTGMGAMPGSDTWAEYRYGFGPYVDGLFSQGNFGVVTKMGFWLMPEPEAFISRRVFVPRRQDLVPLIEIMNALEHGGLIGQPNYGSPLGRLAEDPALREIVQRSDVWTSDALDRFAADRKVASWDCEMQFYGPAQGVRANYEYAKARLLAAIPGARFEDVEDLTFPLSDAQIAPVPHKVAIGVPNMAIFSIGARTPANPDPDDGHLWCAPVIPKSGEAVFKAQQVFNEALKGSDLAARYHPFKLPATWMFRAFVFIVGFPISRTDKDKNRRSREAMAKIVSIGAEHGWGEYRAPPLFQDMVADTYGFNDHVLRRFAETLKDAIDPNGIISAGRGGVWPKHLRGKG